MSLLNSTLALPWLRVCSSIAHPWSDRECRYQIASYTDCAPFLFLYPLSKYNCLLNCVMMTDELIVLVEDNEDDIFFMRRALKGAGITAPVRVLTDGQQASDFLTSAGTGGAGNLPAPGLVFLDLKLPYCTGFEVLEAMRRQGTLENTQVVILTSSPEERDRRRARELGAAAYLVKPPTPAMLKELFTVLARNKTEA